MQLPHEWLDLVAITIRCNLDPVPPRGFAARELNRVNSLVKSVGVNRVN
jgi:hypothetical protein